MSGEGVFGFGAVFALADGGAGLGEAAGELAEAVAGHGGVGWGASEGWWGGVSGRVGLVMDWLGILDESRMKQW